MGAIHSAISNYFYPEQRGNLEFSKSLTETSKYAGTPYDVVIAIDIGTSYSGYAYSFIGDNNIHLNQPWEVPHGFPGPKTLSDVYIDKQGKKHFGFDAQGHYVDEVGDTAGTYFHAIKMKVEYNKTEGYVTVKDESGCSGHDGKEIFASLISFLKERALHEIELTGKDVSCLNVQWVLTVPGMWEDHYRMMMRDAAKKAGLIDHRTSPNLMIALEPEVAAIFCRTLTIGEFDQSSKPFNAEMKKGSNYMVIDAGGGTVDFAFHTVLADDCSKEIIPPSGNKWGGGRVRGKFEKILAEILGEEFLKHCKKREPTVWMEFMSNFGIAKRNMTSGENKPWVMSVPDTFIMVFDEYQQDTLGQKKTFKDAVNEHKEYFDFPGGRYRGRLAFKYEIISPVFAEVAQHIVAHALEKVEEVRGLQKDIQFVYLVGGFAKCSILLDKLKKALPGVKVAVPTDPASVVLKGAVMYGKHPGGIETRTAARTYAVSRYRTFNPGTDDTRFKEKNLIQELVPIIEKGDILKYNHIVALDATTVQLNQKQMTYDIFSTSLMKNQFEKRHPKQVDNIKKLATVPVNIPKGVKAAKVIFAFAGPEMNVIVEDPISKEQLERKIEFDFTTW